MLYFKCQYRENSNKDNVNYQNRRGNMFFKTYYCEFEYVWLNSDEFFFIIS